MVKFLRPKYLFKYLWFAFGLAGSIIVIRQYFPSLGQSLKNSNLVKGVQTELVQNQSTGLSVNPDSLMDLKNLDPQTAGQVLGTVVKQEVSKILTVATEEVKQFPAKQVRKIKIGACEELLEEDICSVASQLDCGSKE